ncbi:MAG TPA: IS1 family transposase [Myxococcales bacterium]|jgi:IS1 family transposase
MANVLPRQKQVAVLNALVEGVSIRSTERMLDVSRETVLSLLVRVGEGCAELHDKMMRDLPCERIECDEIWGYVAKKQRNVTVNDPDEVGDTWTFVGIDASTKLIPSYVVGKRDAPTTHAFVDDLASRMRNKIQIDTDGLALYVDAIESAFGVSVDYARVVKSYEAEPTAPGRYSPARVAKTEKAAMIGEPDLRVASTSFVERQNLTMRMGIRRMTRLTNAFSKKLRNHRAATALHFAHYNLVRRHQTTRVTPAMACGVTDTMWSMEQLLDAALALEAA